MTIIEKLRKKLNSIYSKHLIKTKSSEFSYGEVTLKFVFVPNKNSDALVTVFSGMNANRASYNYINQLNHLQCNRLYVLDDFGHDVLGCYYLGTNGQLQVECAVKALLKDLESKYKFNKYIFCGSSKGGYAALNFGIDYNDSVIICGAPQYRLGYYLTHRKSPELLHVIAGENPAQEFVEDLNSRLSDKIADASNRFRGKIYLHFSVVEHTYSEHIQYLLDDLEKFQYCYNTDQEEYPLHDSVSQYFPPYLIQSLKEAME